MISTHTNRMQAAVSRMERKLQYADGPEDERKIMVACGSELLSDWSRLVEEMTGKSEMLNGSFDCIKDDLVDAFEDKITAAAEYRESLSDPTERAYARGDERREQTHA